MSEYTRSLHDEQRDVPLLILLTEDCPVDRQYDAQDKPHIPTAMITQHMLTYGLSRSPILAARQNVPRGLHRWSALSTYRHSETYPDLFLSSAAGNTPCRYVQVQMNSRTTSKRV